MSESKVTRIESPEADGTRLTLEEVEHAIYREYQTRTKEIYRVMGDTWAARNVRVQEVGHLANLWSVFDDMIREEQ